MTRFSTLLRQARIETGKSLQDLAEAAHVHRTHVHHIESERRVPARCFAEVADNVLGTGGRLTEAYDADDRERREQAATRKTLAASLAASRDLADLAELELDDIHAGVEETVIDYLSIPPGPMLYRANTLREDVLARLRDHHHGPHERADLFVSAGRLSGVLAYAALDLGWAEEAHEHARAAGQCARYAGDMELLLWVRGTQSLIARFQGDYGRALKFVDDGLPHADGVPGTGKARLLCGRVQCLSNLGDSRAATATLNAAEQAREHIARPDSLGGLFEFSETKQRYYSGSSLIWLDGDDNSRRAEQEARAAITSWQAMPPEYRSLDDERLSHIYAATALVKRGEVEGAAEMMQPILALPRQSLISWMKNRSGRVASILSEPRFRGSAAAADLREAIDALNAA